MRLTPMKALRTYRRISQADLGKAVDVDPAIICRIENDQARETPAIIRIKTRIAEFLCESVETIFPPEK
jgi:DNA-binding XRE family transcriptional regulator